MSSGAFTPAKAATQTYQNGLDHLDEPGHLILLKNIYGGLLLSAAGRLSHIAIAGTPGLAATNPGIPRLMRGLTFPVGLICIYFVGAELFTGYPMWFTITLLQRRGKLLQYVRGFLLSWLGNLLGALFFAFTFAYAAEAVAEEPYRSGITSQVTADVVHLACYCTFLRTIGCGFLVTLAMFLGTQNNDGISKAVGLHLLFLISVAVRFPHTVEYMYLTSQGMMLGAKMSFVGFFGRAMLPISLGNTVGGAVFMGLYEWWVFLHCGGGGKKIVTFADDARLHWQDGEDGDD